jgi:hypothetical protein
VTRGQSGRPWSALALLGALLGSLACGATRSTERVFNGRTEQGRYIDSQAYAAYTEGAYREAHGDWAGAELAYRRALLRDGQSPQILTRLGVIACRQSLPRALRHFERATALEEYAPAWLERARCLGSQQKAAPALQAALRSVDLDPESAETNLLVARLYRESAQPARARAWLFAWLLLEPELGDRSAELLRESELLADAELSLLVRGELEKRAAPSVREPNDSRSGRAGNRPPAALIAALRAGELDQARELAAEAHIPPLQLALIATANAKPELGLAQAELLLDANPRDSGALVAGLLAAAQLSDERAFRRLLRRAEGAEVPPVELAQSLTVLLRARLGDEAADSWRQAYLRAIADRATNRSP